MRETPTCWQAVFLADFVRVSLPLLCCVGSCRRERRKPYIRLPPLAILMFREGVRDYLSLVVYTLSRVGSGLYAKAWYAASHTALGRL